MDSDAARTNSDAVGMDFNAPGMDSDIVGMDSDATGMDSRPSGMGIRLAQCFFVYPHWQLRKAPPFAHWQLPSPIWLVPGGT